MNTRVHDTQPSFDKIYPTAPFAELIRLSVSLAGRFAKLRARPTATDPAAEMTQPATPRLR